MESRLRLVVLLVVSSLWMVQADQGFESDIILVRSSGGNVRTRVGCPEELKCSGTGTNINWRVFGIRQDLTNSSTYYILETAVPFGNGSEVFNFTNRLVFPSITVGDSLSYTCTIESGSNSRQGITVYLDVDDEYTAITPPIANIDLSGYSVGETLIVGCPVQTCSTGITVQFLRGEQLVATGMPSRSDERVYVMNLPVTEAVVGEYVCMVRTETPNDLIMQTFNITGIPVSPPTEPTVSSITPESSSVTPMPASSQPNTDTTQDTTQSTTTSASLTFSVQLPTVALMVAMVTLVDLFCL